ncbi:MAG: hypothetical protein JWN76_2920 [Chitinophagaceae bacterium]|nr:hypothetical protein [Chitinophagaceae bacterium]
MVTEAREQFNKEFTENKYEQYLADLDSKHPGAIDFRLAETPVFVDRSFKEKMIAACESIVDVITESDFKERTANAIPEHLKVLNENDHSHFIAFDFGICQNFAGELEPQLIEMQGFPTLFGYQVLQAEMMRKNFSIPGNFNNYLNGFSKDSYTKLLREIIVADCDPENVILLELFPHQQKTRIDFYCTQDYTGVQPVCLTELIKEGKKLFYQKDEKKILIKRIYNRLIFDELEQQSKEVQDKGKILFEELDVEWVPHPNWFYRISKYTLPLIKHQYIPETTYLSDLAAIPNDLEKYVLKPLFSFAGQGVVIDVTKNDIQKITDPHNWILQRKVQYADVIPTPDGPAKAEIRIFYFWKDGEARPVATHNLARLSKGKMIGVRYNKDKTWVGGTIAFFED